MQLFEFAPATTAQRNVLVREEPPDDDDDKSVGNSGEASANDSAVAAASGDESNAITATPDQNETDQQDVEQKTEAAETTRPQFRKNYPKCWFEDEESRQPLRWHLFIGVLYDAMKGQAMLQQSHAFCSNESVTLLPWRIRVHFTSYPPSILPFDIQHSLKNDATGNNDNNNCKEHTNQISTSISRTFRNSLKQALFMQYNSSKVTNSITKSSHEKMWNAILATNYTLYHEVNSSLQMGISSDADKAAVPDLIPVRVLLNGDLPMQKPCRAFRVTDENKTQMKEQSEKEEIVEETTEDEKTLNNLVERLTTNSIRPQTSLGNVLQTWLPQYFDFVDENVVAKPSVYYCVQGIQPNLSCSILDLWRSLCHPDHFLYIVVITNT